jgi:hypothetical protein
MKPWIVFAATLCSCAAAPLPAPPPEQMAAAVTPLPPVDHVPVAQVVKAYRAIESQEVPRITADGVTVDYIKRIHVADLAARVAVGALERQGGHPTHQAIARALAAVSALSAALNATP